MEIGLLLIRLVLGVTLAAHGRISSATTSKSSSSAVLTR